MAVPRRLSYRLSLNYAMWWEPQGGGSTYPNDDVMIAGRNSVVAGNVFGRIAMAFKTGTPGWASDAGLTDYETIFFLYIDGITSDAAGPTLQMAPITSAWDLTSNQATMNALTIGAWNSVALNSSQDKNVAGWYAVAIGSAMLSAMTHGAMFRMLANGCVKILRTPEPYVQQYSAYGTGSTGLTSLRPTLTTAQEALLANSIGGYYKVTQTILIDDYLPADSDIVLVPTDSPGASVVSRELGWPETWMMEGVSRGGATFGRDSNPDLIGKEGYVIESVLYRVDGNTDIELSRSQAIIDTIDELADGTIEVSFRDPIVLGLDTRAYIYDLLLNTLIGVSHDTTSIYGLVVGGSGLHLSQFYIEDWAWLKERFKDVWDGGNLSISEEDQLGSMVDTIGQVFPLFISQSANGGVVGFHVGEYRPSLRIWDVDHGDLVDLKITDIFPSRVYRGVRVTDDTTSKATDSYTPGEISLRSAREAKLYEITVEPRVFEYEEARSALGRQLAVRFAGRTYKVEGAAGPRAAPWDIGDQLRLVTGYDDYGTIPVFLTRIDGDPVSGVIQFEGLHFPDNPEMHSLYETRDDVKGLWRWPGSALTNGAWNSAIGAFTKNSAFNGTPVALGWQGHIMRLELSGVAPDIQGYMTGPAGLVPTSSKVDMIDCTFTWFENPDWALSGFGITTDQNFAWLFAFRKTGGAGTEAVMVGLHRQWAYSEPADDRLFIGHTTDWTVSPIVWSTIDYSPYGLVGIGVLAGSPTIEEQARAYGIGIQWNGTDIRLYCNQQQCAAIAGISKTGYDVFHLRSFGIVTADHRAQIGFGALRWIIADSWLDTSRMQGLNGIDPYYP